jgi:hypothetical protein
LTRVKDGARGFGYAVEVMAKIGLMRAAGILAAALVLIGCAGPRVSAPAPAAQPVPVDYSAEISLLRQDMLEEVPGDISPDGMAGGNWIAPVQAAFAGSPYTIEGPQLVVAVDRNPAVQQLRVIFAVPQGGWAVIGGSVVSTGRTGRYGYFITPTGVFPHSDAILDYRALGTYNENHIRGLGLKGSRVWDFGWQSAEEGWQPGVMGVIRLLIHATDPDVLVPRLGRRDSKGCVRVPAAMNAFLDRHGVLDADYLRDAPLDPAAAAVLSPDLVAPKYPGKYLVIFDSSEATPQARP